MPPSEPPSKTTKSLRCPLFAASFAAKVGIFDRANVMVRASPPRVRRQAHATVGMMMALRVLGKNLRQSGGRPHPCSVRHSGTPSLLRPGRRRASFLSQRHTCFRREACFPRGDFFARLDRPGSGCGQTSCSSDKIRRELSLYDSLFETGRCGGSSRVALSGRSGGASAG